MELTLIIPGEPVAKGRPRFLNGHAITPGKTVNYEVLVKELWAVTHPPTLTFTGEVEAEITAYYSIPQSKSKKVKAAMLEGDIRPTKKPDLDNVAKIILDSLNGLAYRDDSQVVSLKAKKFYSDQPRVLLKLSNAHEGVI